VWDDNVTAADAVADLSTANGLSRVGRVQYEGGSAGVLNEITVRYSPDYGGDLKETRTVTGRHTIGSAPEVLVSPYALASRSRMASVDAAGPNQGVRSKEISSVFVADESTAIRIAMWQCRARGSRRRVVTYEDTAGLLEWIEESEHVTLTDSELALSGVLAMVRSRRWVGQRYYIDLVIIDDILRT
jgi:hypothetical protein